uniref:Serine protease n=1 Tax=Globisporangium ultimum (strain ATCC 200006 / CBS 805.95 / DAOM BR144) TaxID=431595 RepID=K3WRZ5_GLOUD
MTSIVLLLKCFALIAAATSATAANAKRAPAIIADEQAYSLVVNATARVATQDLISVADATFLTVHFAEFNLAEGDKVVVRDVEGRNAFEYTGLGRGELGIRGGFFSSRIQGDQAIVEFQPSTDTNVIGDFGFIIDKITRSSTSASSSTVCGTDDTRPAKCFINDASVPQAYQKSQAVARLMTNGRQACTGWLVGSEGHFLTNEHCINSNDQAANTDYEFLAESDDCSAECQLWGGCAGKIVATSAELLAVDAGLDYALLKLNTTADLSVFGYLQLRVSGAVLNEQIYVPQHPNAWAKRIAAVDDAGNVTRVNKVGVSIPCGEYSLGYTADTQGGSSGSPVIAASDNRVVALHNCGGLDVVCENGGIDIRTLLWDLKNNKKIVLSEDALSDPNMEVPVGPWLPGYTKAPTPAPTPAPTASVCKIFRQQTTCEKTLPNK